MQLRTFAKHYPVPLADLLLAPVLLREAFPFLLGAPPVTAALLRDLASAAGHSDSAVRTTLSRLHKAQHLEVRLSERQGARPLREYHRGDAARSVQQVVANQLTRPDGLTLVVFAFATDASRERHVVREALRVYGFQRLAQNTYISGYTDTSGLEAIFEREGLTQNVFVFQSREALSETLKTKLLALFDLPARARSLRTFRKDALALLNDEPLDDAEATRRLIYLAPVHYQVTFVDEPQLPAAAHPPGYPLQGVVALMPRLVERHAAACVRYFSGFVTHAATPQESSA